MLLLNNDYPEKIERNFRILKTRNGGRRVMDRVLVGEGQAIPYAIRLFFYCFATALLLQSMVSYVEFNPAAALFAENGLLEWIQVGMLLLCSLLLFMAVYHMPEVHNIGRLLMIFPLLACVRELDDVFDSYVFDGAWQMVASAILIYLAHYTFIHWKKIRHQAKRMLAISPSGLLVAGFLMVMIFSRMFGQQAFWKYALQEDYIRLAARIAEEGCETFGYLLLVFGCVELLIFSLSYRKAIKQEKLSNATSS